jgi:hypothetical protein
MGPDMAIEVHNYLPITLKDANMRRSACAVEAIFRAVTILDELPPECLEEIRDFCTDWNKGRQGVESEFKKAWIKMVVKHLNDAKLQERRLFYGITGRPDTKPMSDYELKKTADRGDPGDPNFPIEYDRTKEG